MLRVADVSFHAVAVTWSILNHASAPDVIIRWCCSLLSLRYRLSTFLELHWSECSYKIMKGRSHTGRNSSVNGMDCVLQQTNDFFNRTQWL